MSVQLMRSGAFGHGNSNIEKIQARREARQGKNNNSQPKHNGTINMSELGSRTDTLLMRKQLAKKRAMKVVSDAWAGDKKIDSDIEDRRTHVEELRAEMRKNADSVADYKARKEALKEEYGIENDSQEQKDLELLERQMYPNKDPYTPFTEEEGARLKELEGQPLTEYQQRALELDAVIDNDQEKADKAENEMIAENAAIRSTRIERLKYHGMVDAQKEADEINAAASKEAIGMLIGEAKDHVDETLEEQQEAAKKKAEEKEEQEEKLEEQREEKEEFQEQLELKREENRDAEEARTEQRKNAREQEDLLEAAEANYTGAESLPSQIKAEIKDMLQKMKLLDEDLKGAKVDDTI
ncbi:MAG: hypothetical protein K2H31_11955 [Lachnospiraceae bacterium]|nr:hypothetical protein [Lachnospiraceae bacterium]